MPPRKSDTAASRKSDAGAGAGAGARATAATADEPRPATATSQALSMADLAGTDAQPTDPAAATDARSAPDEKDKEPPKARSSDAVTIEVRLRAEATVSRTRGGRRARNAARGSWANAGCRT